MKGVRIDILGKSTSRKETGKGSIHKVPVLITCGWECEGKVGADCEESWVGCIVSMAERMHGICGQDT
jgi:hypothetical protein